MVTSGEKDSHSQGEGFSTSRKTRGISGRRKKKVEPGPEGGEGKRGRKHSFGGKGRISQPGVSVRKKRYARRADRSRRKLASLQRHV